MSLQIFYPEKAYPVLYEDVMMHQLFPDSKTFADAIPLAAPEDIESLYRKVDRSDRLQISSFVHHWFQLPKTATIGKLNALPVQQHINALWDQLIRGPDKSNEITTLIPLPYRYVVPGGRFREIYYWDSYFTMLGLRESGKMDILKEMVQNFAWELDHIGHIPNGNRSYFLSRSQPPFFSLMIELLAEVQGPEVLAQYQSHLLREYSFWMDGIENSPDAFRRIIKMEDHGYLNRYYDDNNSPRTESFAEDRKLFAESGKSNRELYRDIRAACESGWDFSSRWLAKEDDLASIQTTNIIPVDLNSLLYLLEKAIEKSLRFQSASDEANIFETRARRRAELINSYLWKKDNGIFSDFNFSEKAHGIPSLAMMYPLFAGIATQEQAEQTITFVSSHFLKPGGWVTSNHNTGQQWDAPNGWAPLQWITFVGLKNYGATELAEEGAERWLDLNEQVHHRTGRMMEKYNVEDLSLAAGGGEYPVQDGFGWTNGVYLALAKELHKLNDE